MKTELVTEWKTFDEYPDSKYTVTYPDQPNWNGGLLEVFAQFNVQLILGQDRLYRIIEEKPIPTVKYVDMTIDGSAYKEVVRVKLQYVGEYENSGWLKVNAIEVSDGE